MSHKERPPLEWQLLGLQLLAELTNMAGPKNDAPRDWTPRCFPHLCYSSSFHFFPPFFTCNLLPLLFWLNGVCVPSDCRELLSHMLLIPPARRKQSSKSKFTGRRLGVSLAIWPPWPQELYGQGKVGEPDYRNPASTNNNADRERNSAPTQGTTERKAKHSLRRTGVTFLWVNRLWARTKEEVQEVS